MDNWMKIQSKDEFVLEDDDKVLNKEQVDEARSSESHSERKVYKL